MAKAPKKAADEEPEEPEESVSDGTISTKTAYELLQISHTMFYRLVRSGHLPEPAPAHSAHSRVSIVACVRGYIRYLKEDRRANSRTGGESRVQIARAREIEMRIAREDAHLCEVEECIGFVDMLVGLFKSNLAGLPAQITRDLAERQRIELIIDELASTLTKSLEQGASLLRKGRDPTAAADESVPGSMGSEQQEVPA